MTPQAESAAAAAAASRMPVASNCIVGAFIMIKLPGRLLPLMILVGVAAKSAQSEYDEGRSRSLV
jgi:hypothetical protein